jgi:CRP-like cAMP-binding protein
VSATATPPPASPFAGADRPPADRGRGIALLRADAELRAVVPADEQPLAERVAVVPVQRAEPGAWNPRTLERDAREPFAAVLIEGVLTREVTIAERGTTQLIGPGDVFNPWPETRAVLPTSVEWRVAEPAVIAVLDQRFLNATRRWPQLGAVLMSRLAAQSDRMAVQCALTALPRVEQRVTALFWHLAERWGRVGSDGVVVPLRLTHDQIGRLVGAQRPTVTLALRDLNRDGIVTRLDQSHWLLQPGSERSLTLDTRAAA